MGMYDSIYIPIKCPYCHKTSEMECQTKELEQHLQKYIVGSRVGDQLNYEDRWLDCVVDCHSEECTNYLIKKIGYTSGFGRVFNVQILISEGVITNQVKISTH